MIVENVHKVDRTDLIAVIDHDMCTIIIKIGDDV